MVDFVVGSDVSCSRGESSVPSEDHAYQSIVEVRCCVDCIERAFGQCTFRSSSCGRRRLARHRAHVIDEQFRDLLVVDWVEDTERKDFDSIDFIRRIVPTAANYTSNWEDAWVSGRELSVKSCTELCQVFVTGSKVWRVLGEI